MTVKWSNYGLFYLDFGRLLFLSQHVKGSDQFLSHHLDRPSQASQHIELKKSTNYSTQSKPN